MENKPLFYGIIAGVVILLLLFIIVGVVASSNNNSKAGVVKEKIIKRANRWKKRFKDCGFDSEILEKTQIILLVKSFTIPEFARKENVDYDDSIVKIRRRIARDK